MRSRGRGQKRVVPSLVWSRAYAETPYNASFSGARLRYPPPSRASSQPCLAVHSASLTSPLVVSQSSDGRHFVVAACGRERLRARGNRAPAAFVHAERVASALGQHGWATSAPGGPRASCAAAGAAPHAPSAGGACSADAPQAADFAASCAGGRETHPYCRLKTHAAAAAPLGVGLPHAAEPRGSGTRGARARAASQRMGADG